MIPGSANSLLLASAAAAGGYQIERSLRFNSSDSALLSRVAGTPTNNKIFTFSTWFKRSAISTAQRILFAAGANSTGGDGIFFGTPGDQLHVCIGNVGVNDGIQTTAVFRDVSAWYHIVVAVDTTQATASNRIKLYVNGSQITTFTLTNYPSQNASTTINNSGDTQLIGRFGYASYGGYLDGCLAECYLIDGQALTPSSFTEVSATTGQLIPIEYTGTFGTNGFYLQFADNSSNTAATLGKDTSGNSNNWTPNNFSVGGVVSHVTGGLSYRDSSSSNQTWDDSSTSSSTSNAIGPDRRWWVDLGSSKSFNKITFNVVASGQSADTSANFVTNFSTTSNSGGSTICIGGCTVILASSPSGATPGTITVTFDGFTSQTGRYIAISNGDGTRGGTYTYSNLQIYGDQPEGNDSLVDTPTSISATDTGVGGEVRGNYATFNPLNQHNASDALSNGNLDLVAAGGSAGLTPSTIGVSSGKWYCEFVFTGGTANDLLAGIRRTDSRNYDNSYLYRGNSNLVTNGSVGSNYGSGFALNDVVGVAFDADNGKLFISVNGTFTGSGNPVTSANPAFSSITGTYNLIVGTYGNICNATANFGQRAFAYTAPSGFKALCDTNLGAPLVAKPNELMDAVIYTGNGSTQTISGLGFSPDFLWFKSRSNSGQHRLYDTIRGATNAVYSNLTNAEESDPNTLTAFNSSGFSLGSSDGVNGSSWTYVAWAWDAGTSTVSNTQGSITSQVRANVSAGFSVVGFNSGSSGAKTIGHGLGVAPSLLICKNRDGSANWTVYHSSATNVSQFLMLNSTNAVGSSSNIWGSAAPTSTVFGFDSGTNQAANVNIICYAFAPVAGYSSFGSWVGSGTTNDGAFIYTGFRPRFILLKNSDNVEQWYIYDSARRTYNVQYPDPTELRPNSSAAEGSASLAVTLDFLSNGFKIRGNTGAEISFVGRNYIYAAFAESPFQYARAR
jgi:hypothetical protein